MSRPILWRSTRGGPSVSLSEAISAGLAPDGGLYVPESFGPKRDLSRLSAQTPLWQVAVTALQPLFEGDALEAHLEAICREALNFPLILRRLGEDGPLVLELFHGPTAAFKDFGARFLARCLQRIRTRSCILVATSGDTGGAVASAFWRVPGCEVVILFPEGRVSPRQQHQLTAWGENVRAYAVRGDFDDCQRMVKACFQDPELVARHHLTSANSINAGRLLPQSTYYAAASLMASHHPLNLIVPTGNLGNALSALWAREMGFDVGRVTLATNANPSLSRFFESGRWSPLPTVATLANAMDVGNPSNLERLLSMHSGVQELLAAGVSVQTVSDSQIRVTIVESDRLWGEAICPHTATALRVWLDHPDAATAVVATAHPAKFESVVEPLLGRTLEIPAALDTVLERSEKYETISAVPGDLAARLG